MAPAHPMIVVGMMFRTVGGPGHWLSQSDTLVQVCAQAHGSVKAQNPCPFSGSGVRLHGVANVWILARDQREHLWADSRKVW